jgi:WD40 repeat protein/tRNA A-37 threonylcarbamoyl transferase component Bud32
VGRFVVWRQLGEGAFGLVYLAHDPQLQRQVALKVAKPATLRDPQRVERFLREARSAAQLHHPHIVPVFDAGKHGEDYYIAAEFVRGQTLEAALAAGRFDFRRTARIVRALAEALAYAHEQCIVHRDVKPSNVMLDDKGEPHLMDFGLAARQDESEKLTHDGTLMGTPLYMAPEQAAGKTSEVGPASDQYSLGVVLYEMLCGQTPFGGSRQAAMVGHLGTEPPRPRNHDPRIPRDLETICLKTLAKKPAERYASCGELAEDLQRWLEDRPIKARRASVPERLVKWGRRQPALAALTFSTILAVVLGFVGVKLWAEAERRAHDFAERAREMAVGQRNRAEAEKQRADAERFRAGVRSFLERGVNLCEMGDVSRGLVLLAHALRLHDVVKTLPPGAQDEKELRAQQEYLEHLEWLIRANLAGWHPRQAIRLRAQLPHRDWAWDAAFSPDGKLAATACKDGFARLWDAGTGRLEAELPLEMPPLPATLRGPLGLVLGPAVDLPARMEGWVVRFSPDGKRLLTAGSAPGALLPRGAVQLWDVASKKSVGPSLPHWAMQTNIGIFSTAAFSPDGMVVLSQVGPRTLALFDASTGQFRGSPWHFRSPFLVAVVSPDGKTLAVGDADGGVRLWSLETRLPVGPGFKHKGPVTALQFSPDGRLLLSGCWVIDPEKKGLVERGEARLWDTEAGEPVGPGMPQPGRVKAVAFSPDGRLCLTAGIGQKEVDGKPALGGWAQLWDARTGLPVGSILRAPLPIWSAAFSGDGSRVVTACEDGVAHVWCAHTGKELGPRPRIYSNQGNVRIVAAHPNGRSFLVGNATNHPRALLLDVGPPAQAGRPLAEPHGVGAVGFTADGKTLLTGGDDGKVRFWEVAGGRLLSRSVQLSEGLTVRQFGPDGRTCVAVSGPPGKGRRGELWDLANGSLIGCLPCDEQLGAAAYSPDGQKLATTRAWDHPGQTRLWDTASGTRRAEVTGPTNENVNSLAFAGDGQLLVAPGGFGSRKPWLWDGQTGKVLRTFPAQPLPIYHVACDRRGRALVALDRGEVRLWEWHGDEARPIGVPLLHPANVGSIGFSPDGRLALTTCADKAQLWDPLTGLRLGPALEQDAAVRAAAFDPAGRLVATAGANKQVRLWPVPVPLKGSAEQVQCWVEAITRQRLELQPTEAILPLEDDEVGKRYVRLRTELGGSPE